MSKKIHLGQNIRHLRILRGMKQSAFASELGIAQQNVSKMENKKILTERQLEQVAEVLNITVDSIINFDHSTIINSSIFFTDQNFLIKDIITFFKEELTKKDEKIEQLIAALKDKQSKKDHDLGTSASNSLVKSQTAVPNTTLRPYN